MLGVVNIWLNLAKAPVRIRMFFLPSLEGSTFMKFIHRRSSGLCAIIESSLVLDLKITLHCLASWTILDIASNILECGSPIESLPA